MSNKQTHNEKSQSKLQVFFMVILIPAVFAVILAVVLLYYLGFNVGETFQQAASLLPFVEQEEDEGEELSDEQYIAQLEHENQSFSNQIQQLENELAMKDEELERLENDFLATQSEELAGEDTEDITADLTDIVKTLEEMTASRAADIIAEMSEEEAVTYLRMMRSNSRSDILSRVEPELAASLLSRMSN